MLEVNKDTLLGTNISLHTGTFEDYFPLVSWRVCHPKTGMLFFVCNHEGWIQVEYVVMSLGSVSSWKSPKCWDLGCFFPPTEQSPLLISWRVLDKFEFFSLKDLSIRKVSEDLVSWDFLHFVKISIPFFLSENILKALCHLDYLGFDIKTRQ